MRTIPDDVLDAIVASRPQTRQVVERLRTDPDAAMVPQWETWIAQQALFGTIPEGLSGRDILHLSACYYGDPWGGDWVRGTHAAAMLDVDDSRIRQRIAAGDLPAIKRGKTWYVKRSAIER